MYDLIDECGTDLLALGYKLVQSGRYSLCTGKVEVTSEEEEKNTGFEKGSYLIYNCPLLHGYGIEAFDYISSEVSKGIKKLLRKHSITKRSRILIVGLGNCQILADALGGKVLEKIDFDMFKKPLRIFKFAPNIFANTGINSFDVVHMLSIWLDIDALIIIDALATKSLDRLTTSIQINDVGMTPASAVNNLGKKLCHESLGLTCISIGVPTMLLGETILTPKDIRIELENLSKIIAMAIMQSI